MPAPAPRNNQPPRYIFLEDDDKDNQVPSVNERGLDGNLSREITGTRASRDDGSLFPAQPTNLAPNQSCAQHSAIRFITLRLRYSARYQRETEVRVGRTELLGGMMKRFATTLEKGQNQLRFIMYDGRRIEIGNTATELEMEDGEVIDVLEEQLGGVFKPVVVFRRDTISSPG